MGHSHVLDVVWFLLLEMAMVVMQYKKMIALMLNKMFLKLLNYIKYIILYFTTNLTIYIYRYFFLLKKL